MNKMTTDVFKKSCKVSFHESVVDNQNNNHRKMIRTNKKKITSIKCNDKIIK